MKRDRSISQHQVVAPEVMDLVQHLLGRLDQEAIAKMRGCEVGDLYYTINHPFGWTSREEVTGYIDIEVGNYGEQPFMDTNGRMINSCGGFEIENIYRLVAPYSQVFTWGFDSRVEPGYMWGYGDDSPDYGYVVKTINLKAK